MKLQILLFIVEGRFKKIYIKNLEDHIEAVKASDDYNNLKTRIAWDCLRSCFTSAEICSWYNKYDCNDSHIDTLAKKAFDNVFGGILC